MIFEFKGIEHWEYFERYAYKGEKFSNIWKSIREKAMEYDEPVRSAVDVLIRIAEKVHERLGAAGKFYKEVIDTLSKSSSAKQNFSGRSQDELVKDFKDFDYKVLQLFKVEFNKKFNSLFKKTIKKDTTKINADTGSDLNFKQSNNSNHDLSGTSDPLGNLIQKSLQDIINNAKGVS